MLLDDALKNRLRDLGVESHQQPGSVDIPEGSTFEPPCSIKWISPHFSLDLGAFSYAVSGYLYGCEIGRYCSIGESVQIGRQDHPTDWLSTSPFQYIHEKLFEVGSDFEASTQYHLYKPHLGRHEPRKTKIGNDVWIGHGAYIRPGITIGDGAIIAGHSVVTRNVPPYAIVAGNPAKIKRFRFDEQTIDALLKVRWWRFPIWDLNFLAFNNVSESLHALQSQAQDLKPYTTALVQVSERFEEKVRKI